VCGGCECARGTGFGLRGAGDAWFESPASITLTGRADGNTPSYPHLPASRNPTPLGFGHRHAGGNVTSWKDTNVSVGSYEYQIETGGSYGHGFIYCGNPGRSKDIHGKLILVVDNSSWASCPRS